MVSLHGIEPRLTESKSAALPLDDREEKLVGDMWIEHMTNRLWAGCSYHWANPPTIKKRILNKYLICFYYIQKN